MSRGDTCPTRPPPPDQPRCKRPRSGWSMPRIVETSDTFYFILYPNKNVWIRNYEYLITCMF
jgi:hypothetical protein